MDGHLTPPSQPSGGTAKFLSPSGAMPVEAPLEMPVQDRHRAPPSHPLETSPVTWLARLIAAAATLGIFGYGLLEMLAIVGFGNMTSLQAAMIVFFAITLLWIAFSAGSALCGLLTPRARFATVPADGSRTALVMPVYNEDPLRTTAALQAMAEALGAVDAAKHFEIVIVSDSTNADAWIAETLAAERLRSALATIMPVRYRRRWHNIGRKVGNIEDFVKRWGGHYDYMIVLDADSLMSPDTLLALVERMHADPQLGILQTVPALIGQVSFFARLQQFASRLYGGVIARGMASWSGNEGNYWGHNAIIRVRAFAEACGLPQLPGRKPFGGFVLSHDFIEAAYIRRAGWKVQMAADLQGSWEEGPPSLTDIAVRDRRWAQGNLQHLKLIGTRGLKWTNRLHLGVGIMSYLASPLWLMLILIGFALTLQATLIRPEYFSKTFQLFPDWPVFDARRMMMLFLFSMLVLLTPKMIGLLRGWLFPSIRRKCGGFLGVPISAVVELMLSALYAPVMMLIQTEHVFSILTGRDSEWIAQRRQAEVMSWRESTHYHWKHTIIGIVLGVIAYLLSPTLLAWLSPTVAGLVLAIPLSKASGSVRLGQWFSRVGLFRIPEEHETPWILRRRDEIMHAAEPLPAEGLRYLARHPVERAAHITNNLARPHETRGHPNAHRLTAAAKVMQAQSLREALGWLSAPERIEVAADRELLEQLGQLPQVEAVG
ncbi:glucans biosynthesis glucosyltransferase MdoH [Povalibacter sp.]|uniref:glucans biosynthesis glucosyltransferase MdoH n=1 Tax=Povalibacter sp. TaxID=1962978 RepID=UPI002F42A428